MIERNAYVVLQVARDADDEVVRAAYRALARRYHPDGSAPDNGRMAELNAAWEQLKTPEARRRYDDRPVGVAVGPGPSPEPAVYDPYAARRASTIGQPMSSPVIDFGRYEGWTVSDIARHDPEYLRWLSRHSSGLRYRDAIASLLGSDGVGRRGDVVA